METLVKELNNYMQNLDKDLLVSFNGEFNRLILWQNYNDLVSIDMDIEKIIFPEPPADEYNKDEAFNFINNFQYIIKPFILKTIELFNSKEKYCYYMDLNEHQYYLGVGCREWSEGAIEDEDFNNKDFYAIKLLPYIKVRFFENDIRLENINLNNLIKINSEEEFGNNFVKLKYDFEVSFSEIEKELLRKLLIKK